jgi:hypothetical protein
MFLMALCQSLLSGPGMATFASNVLVTGIVDG